MNKDKIPKLKKDIKDFLSEEEGSMVKKDVVKMGIGLIALSIGLKSGMGANDVNAAPCCRCGTYLPGQSVPAGGSPDCQCYHVNY